MFVSVDRLQNLRAAVLKDNPPARSDSVLAMKLFRMALREKGKDWENAAFDRCFASLTLREQRNERPAPAPVREPIIEHTQPTYSPPPQPTEQQREATRAAGRSKYDRARDAIMAMRFPNGQDLRQQTVEGIQKLGSWAGAIIRALPRNAKPTDKIGQHLSWDQLVRLRTFEVEAA